MTYYVLKMMGWVGLVWDIREPPARVLEEGLRLDQEKRNQGQREGIISTRPPALGIDP